MNEEEKELIKAYFEGGNAKGQDISILKGILELIRDTVATSEKKPKMATTFHPSHSN